MSPLLNAQTWVMVNGVLTRRGHTPFDPGVWEYGVTRPDVLGQSGLPLGTPLITLAAGAITLTDAGPTGPANLAYTGSGTFLDPYYIYRVRSNGTIYNRQANTYTYFKECDLTLNTATIDSGIINSNQSGTAYKNDSVVLELCDIHGLRPWGSSSGTFGHSMTTIRCHIYNICDGFGWMVNSGIANNNAYNKDYGSWIDKLCYTQGVDGNGPANSNPGGITSPAQQRIDGSHSDACQIQGGRGHHMFGTFLDGVYDGGVVSGLTKFIRKNTNYPLLVVDNGYPYYGTLAANTCIMVNQNEGTGHPTGDILCDKVWFGGAHWSKIIFSGTNYVQGGAMQYDDIVFSNCIWLSDGGIDPDSYYNAAKAGVTRANAINQTPSHPISLPSGSNLASRWSTLGNKMENGDPVPWRDGSTTVKGYLG